MTQDEVLSLMRSSKTSAEWDANCYKVKVAHNGEYPPYWFSEVIRSGLIKEVMGPGAGEIEIITFLAR